MPNLPTASGVELPQNQAESPKKRILVLAVLVVLLIITIGGYFYLQTLPSFRYRQEIKKIDALISSIQALTPQDVAAVFPGHPEIQDQNVDVAKFNVEEPLRKSKEAFKQGDVEEGRKYLLEAAKFMSGFAFVADPKEGMPLTPDVKGQHDPLDKYIKNARPSQVWLDSMYLPVIKILVSTDK